MSQFKAHRTSNCYYTTLIIAVFPLAIYFFQLLGKLSPAFACIAGVLIVLKVIVELFHQYRQRAASRRLALRAPLVVPVQPPIAGCYLCQKLRALRLADLGGHRVGICQCCHGSLSFTASNR